MRYVTRNHALSPVTTWELDGAVLRLSSESRATQTVPLTDIAEVRLDFSPTRAERNRFRVTLHPRGGSKLVFFNRSFRGFADFADTSAEYVAFVRALHAALARHAPGCRFHVGTTWPFYVLNFLVTVFIGCCFAAIAWFLYRINLTWLLALKILILIFYVPTLLYWLVRNRPRRYQPSAIPTGALPADLPTQPTTAASP